MSKTMDIGFALPVGSIDSYQQTALGIPALSAEEERELAKRLRENNDLDAARKLILSHLRYVVYIAKTYSGYGLPHADLIQEGNIGLMKAVKRFAPTMNVRLISFAVHWIRAEIHEYILRNWRIVKVATTKAQRKLFFNLRSSKSRLGWFSKEEVESVAHDLGVKAETVLEMEARMSNHDVAFDGQANDDGDDQTAAHIPSSYLSNTQDDPAFQLERDDWEDHKLDRLQVALASLNERSRDIVQRRWLAEEKATLHDLAAEYQVSAERIRQLESSAMKKLKSALES